MIRATITVHHARQLIDVYQLIKKSVIKIIKLKNCLQSSSRMVLLKILFCGQIIGRIELRCG